MNTSILEYEHLAMGISFSEDSLSVNLNDGRCITVPLAWYPRLLAGTKREREHYEFIGGGEGIHWPGLDEDILVNEHQFSKFAECPHDLDIDFDGLVAIEDAGEHGNSMFGKCVRTCREKFQMAEVITICDKFGQLFSGQLKHEVFRESFYVTFDGLI